MTTPATLNPYSQLMSMNATMEELGATVKEQGATVKEQGATVDETATCQLCAHMRTTAVQRL